MAAVPARRQAGHVTLRILVVDDSAHFRRTVGELLNLRGFDAIAAAADGAQALALVSEACPDAALVDINLPGPDGLAVARSLAAVCPRVTIVLTSSDLDTMPRALLSSCGATAFVPKTDLATVDLRRIFAG